MKMMIIQALAKVQVLAGYLERVNLGMMRQIPRESLLKSRQKLELEVNGLNSRLANTSPSWIWVISQNLAAKVDTVRKNPLYGTTIEYRFVEIAKRAWTS
jgi:hypothetical protein